MNKTVMILLIVGVCLLLLGGAVFTIAMAKTGWDFSALSNAVYEEKTFETAAADVSKIAVKANTEDFSFVTSEDDKIHVLYYNKFDKKGNPLTTFEPTVADGTLSLTANVVKKWHMDMGFSKSKTFVISVPAGKKVEVSADLDTGDVKFCESGKEMAFTALDLKSDTGDVCFLGTIGVDAGVEIRVHTGDLKISGALTVAETVHFKASTGECRISAAVSAKAVKLETNTGDIKITAAVTTETFESKTNTGDVKADAALTANAVTVRSDTGDVKLLLAGHKEDYTCLLSTDTGRVSPKSYTGGAKTVNIDVDTGDIQLRVSQES